MKTTPLLRETAVATALLILAATTPVAAAPTTVEARIVQVASEDELVARVPAGPHRGLWSLKLRSRNSKIKAGTKIRITGDSEVFEKREGEVVVAFKGSDEELQAIIDWLGSLE